MLEVTPVTWARGNEEEAWGHEPRLDEEPA
jgi:hypothetical protein